MARKPGEGPYAGNRGDKDPIRQSKATDSAGNPREPKRQINVEGRGYAAAMPKDARFGGGAMTRGVSRPATKKYIGG
jgi:hypothetical protein